MAYAFNKIDDYFRRNKSGGQGSLDRGNAGAPPPTQAANGLARTAETSAEQGNSGTSQYRAARGADTSGIASRVSEPARQQSQTWNENANKLASDFTANTNKQISQTYKPFDANDIKAVEVGSTDAANRVRQQMAYTGNEIQVSPFAMEAPKLDSSASLSGGVGGISAALQQRGGRYTPGMAALDASVMAADKTGLQGIRSNLANMNEANRTTAMNLSQTDENLAKGAKSQAVNTSNLVRQSLYDRLPQIQAMYAPRNQAEAQKLSEQSRAAANPQDALMNALKARGLTSDEALKLYNPSFRSLLSGYGGVKEEQLAPTDMSKYLVTNTGAGQYQSQIAPEYQNIASILGITAQPQNYSYDTYGINQDLINQTAGNLVNQYRYGSSLNPEAAALEQERLARDERVKRIMQSQSGIPGGAPMNNPISF